MYFCLEGVPREGQRRSLPEKGRPYKVSGTFTRNRVICKTEDFLMITGIVREVGLIVNSLSSLVHRK